MFCLGVILMGGLGLGLSKIFSGATDVYYNEFTLDNSDESYQVLTINRFLPQKLPRGVEVEKFSYIKSSAKEELVAIVKAEKVERLTDGLVPLQNLKGQFKGILVEDSISRLRVLDNERLEIRYFKE